MNSIKSGLPPLSLYIHIPWCIRKCPYCDFNSHRLDGEAPERDYVNALLADLKQDHDYIQGRQIDSIFIGGGTPSLFSAAAFSRLLDGMATEITLADDIEITLEANPGTFEQEKFSGYRQAGINRLSVGIQSFNPDSLKILGRIHNDSEARRAADIARQAGFDNFNLDLMFGLPQQNTERALADLASAIACEPAHLSWYQLTLEPNTEFYRYPPALPLDDEIANMQQAGQVLLAEQGYAQYEISAYAQPGRQARHNLNYWQFGDYLGIGAGAHGKVSLADGSILRTRKTRQPAHYLDSTRRFQVEAASIATQDLPLEFMMNAMRLVTGSDQATFEGRTGLPLANMESKLVALQQRGLVEYSGQKFRPSPRGLQFLNDILLEFMP